MPALLALLTALVPLSAQEAGVSGSSAFAGATVTLERQLEESLQELSDLRERMAADKIPLDRRLRELETELTRIRDEYQEATRLLDSRTLDLSKLTGDLEDNEQQAIYLSDLFGQYARGFESRLHIAELQRYAGLLDAATMAPEYRDLAAAEVYRIQSDLLAASLDRLEDALGGTRFKGSAVDSDRRVRNGTFALVGPVALFRSEDGSTVGSAEQRLGSLEPTVLDFADPEDAAVAGRLVAEGSGYFPLDPTMGNARKIEATEETFLEHVEAGGVVMYPIFGMAGLALLIALYKWIQLTFVRRPSRAKVGALLAAVSQGDEEAVEARVLAIRGPIGRMLAAGVEHIREPRELIEEVMYETVLATRLKVQGLLPFVAICAASAPLLGLLGTVTGIISTFKRITVFGSGDVKTLSGGISEALITTEFGLIVAIPSLLLHAFLSRKANRIVNQMEAAGVAFVNQVSKTPFARVRSAPATNEHVGGGTPDPELVRHQVNEILNDLLIPLVQENRSGGSARGNMEPVGRKG